MSDLSQRMGFLEQRYHDLYREVRASRAELNTETIDDDTIRSLRNWIDGAEREMRDILREVERIEDSLLDSAVCLPGTV